MYIVAIAWIYVALMVSITQPSTFRAIVTFAGTGLLPLALFLWLMGTPQRRRNRARDEAREQAAQDGTGSGDPDH